jgi:hypothetical protein
LFAIAGRPVENAPTLNLKKNSFFISAKSVRALDQKKDPLENKNKIRVNTKTLSM